MKTYVVKFWGGAGGHFIQELILCCETQTDKILDYPQGHAHTFLGEWINENIENAKETSDQQQLKKNSDYDFIIIHGGNPDHIKRIYNRDPKNFSMIRVVVENILDVALSEYNHFYKNQYIEPYNKDYGLFEHYQRLVKNNVIDKQQDSIEMPIWKDMSTDNIVHILKETTLKTYNNRDDLINKKNQFTELKKEISYEELTIKEIMFGSPKVLEIISKVVGKPITSAMKINFDRYHKAQIELHQMYPAYTILRDTFDQWNLEIKTN